MAQDTFGTLWKGLLLRCPDLPSTLAQAFVRYSYRRALDATEWGATRAVSAWSLPAVYTTGTCTVTSASTTVTGVGTTWTTAAHAGKQFRVPNGAWYTISSVGSTTSITLDRAYVGTTTALLTYEISQVYVTPASNFKQLISIWDPVNNRRLRKGFSQEYLDAKDPQRSNTGPPVMAASAYFTGDIPMYELWPRTTTALVIPYRYYIESGDPSDSTTIIAPLGGETIMDGAIYECARHPGTTEKPNPYFNMQIADRALKSFESGIQSSIRIDQNMYNTDFYTSEEQLPLAPMMDLNYLINHDPLWNTWYST